jgi:hypothetical protein
MGVTYKALDVDLRCPVTLKMHIRLNRAGRKPKLMVMDEGKFYG